MLLIDEIFGPTIQGEGKKIGTPSIFIRFSKCNMQCKGFGVKYKTSQNIQNYGCDSFYAVDMFFKNRWQLYSDYMQVVDKVNNLLLSSKLDIVITGGEPLLYWKNEEFQKLLKYYIDNNFNVTIETNGSLDINIANYWQKKILFSISVKLSNSGESFNKRINTNTLTNIINLTRNSYIKFIINKELLAILEKEIISILEKIPKCDIYIMPLGDTRSAIDKNSLCAVNTAIKYNYIYSDRLHIRIWNNKRGV